MPSSSPIVVSQTGSWQPVLTGPGMWLVTSNDNFDYCWSEAAPPETLPGHFGNARHDRVFRLLPGEQFFVRALRPMTLTVTPDA